MAAQYQETKTLPEYSAQEMQQPMQQQPQHFIAHPQSPPPGQQQYYQPQPQQPGQGQPQVVYVQTPPPSGFPPQSPPTPGFSPQQQQAGVPQQQYFDPKGYPQAQTQQVHPQHPQQPQHPQVQGQAPGRTYQNVTPLPSLGRSPAPVDCPACGQRSMTRITYVAGGYTHAWAAGLCVFTWFFCFVPYLIDGMKNVDHHCGNCGVMLATWHKSGTVDIHQHS
ncbi:Lipopolysaccharide-induced tumor necrosis factor-alpha factor-like protein [Lachnellula occidentalis]|uniref:Lipopolysaccharide-induced tumor necrosis factor-alpha factor-like protein n=1 Tax=Lachnellula occidentalis TaxID=215460 RepID=A0A8H8RRQ1_9HELO|nr:Lipopolysaccharide-induced tumor necrosis factor-alpha factor-like protein [Lachnellula occidentalis]